jgi:hypothetical protein
MGKKHIFLSNVKLRYAGIKATVTELARREVKKEVSMR